MKIISDIEKSEWKQKEKQTLIERDIIWRFNEFDLTTFVSIRHKHKSELMGLFYGY